jgi:hypothetical protein
MVTRALGAILIAGVCATWASDDSTRTRLDRIEQQFNSVMSKAGIHLGGEFRSQFLFSTIDTASPGLQHDRRIDESVEFTSVDFDISARPNDAISGRLIFRMHQDWRNFFSDVANPIFSRWISIDGRFKNMFGYNAGDFRQRYSPLTLWAPQIEIPYEPEIFSRLREVAMKEEFLGSNDRVMQGLNFNFDAELSPILKELHWNVMGARLRQREVNIKNGNAVADEFEVAPMDKYMAATNLDLLILPGLNVGGSFLDIFDNKFSADASTPGLMDTMPQQTAIVAGRVGVGTSTFMATDRFGVRADIEFAGSIDDSNWFDIDTIATPDDTTLQKDKINGTALAADINAFVALGTLGKVTLKAGYLANSADYRNELAQSPTFFGTRIMNVENDSIGGILYSSYDALYRSVFKFTPSSNWVKDPFRKIAYTKALFNQEELHRIVASKLDPALQLVMPYGPATPNRAGLRANLGLEMFNRGLTASGDFLSVAQVTPDSIMPGRMVGDSVVYDSIMVMLPKTRFLQAGLGASIDIASLVKVLPYPLRFSAGYQFSSAVNAGATGYALTQSEINSSFFNAGLTWQFWTRASLLFGWQDINTSIKIADAMATMTTRQTHWSTGLMYKVSDGGRITASIGQIAVSNTDDDNATTTAVGVMNDPSLNDFKQWQTELFLTVLF